MWRPFLRCVRSPFPSPIKSDGGATFCVASQLCILKKQEEKKKQQQQQQLAHPKPFVARNDAGNKISSTPQWRQFVLTLASLSLLWGCSDHLLPLPVFCYCILSWGCALRGLRKQRSSTSPVWVHSCPWRVTWRWSAKAKRASNACTRSAKGVLQTAGA